MITVLILHCLIGHRRRCSCISCGQRADERECRRAGVKPYFVANMQCSLAIKTKILIAIEARVAKQALERAELLEMTSDV